MRCDGSTEHIYAGAMGCKSGEILNILSTHYDNDKCTDLQKAWGIIRECVYNQFEIKNELKLHNKKSGHNKEEHSCGYLFEAMEGRFIDLDGKLSWKMYDHDEILDLLGSI